MPNIELPDYLYGDPTQYPHRAAPGATAYCETPAYQGLDFDPVGASGPAPYQWPRVLIVAVLGLCAALLLAFLTLQLVRAGEPAGATPSGAVTKSVTTVMSDSQVARDRPTTITVAPTGAARAPVTTVTVAPTQTSRAPVTTTVTIPTPPPATMTNPLEPPATMTNPLEPPATMTNPLEPPATMTNPLEPPLGAPIGAAD